MVSIERRWRDFHHPNQKEPENNPTGDKSRPGPLIPQDIMNKTERLFADFCEMRKHLKEIVDWVYEPCRLILSPNISGKRNAVSYLPDFMIVYRDHFEFVEIKAKRGDWTSMRDDARVKVNIAAARFPWFKFTVAFLEKGEWTFEKV